MSYETVNGLFTGIADAIRSVDGTVDSIAHQDMPTKIAGIPAAYTSGATAVESDILLGKTAYVDGEKKTGTNTALPDMISLFNKTIITHSIPEEIVKIPRYCYSSITTLQSITFPSTLQTIGGYAFFLCTGLLEVSFNDNCTEIYANAFQDCTSLVTVSTNKVTSLSNAEGAGTYFSNFAGCTSLQSISCPMVTSYGGSLASRGVFRGDTSLQTAALGSIGYPVTSIAAYVFELCTQAGLTITIYVTPDTQPLDNSPWGATNATIVYRSAVDGSVL